MIGSKEAIAFYIKAGLDGMPEDEAKRAMLANFWPISHFRPADMIEVFSVLLMAVANVIATTTNEK